MSGCSGNGRTGSAGASSDLVGIVLVGGKLVATIGADVRFDTTIVGRAVGTAGIDHLVGIEVANSDHVLADLEAAGDRTPGSTGAVAAIALGIVPGGKDKCEGWIIVYDLITRLRNGIVIIATLAVAGGRDDRAEGIEIVRRLVDVVVSNRTGSDIVNVDPGTIGHTANGGVQVSGADRDSRGHVAVCSAGTAVHQLRDAALEVDVRTNLAIVGE